MSAVGDVSVVGDCLWFNWGYSRMTVGWIEDHVRDGKVVE